MFEKESEERVEAVDSHPINALNADHNAGVAYTNMANVSRGFGQRREDREGSGRESEGGMAQGCKTPWNYQQSLPSPCGWMGGTDSVHSAPLDHRPTGYLSCLLVYEIQHCYLAPHRRVLGTVWPLVSAEFPTLKGRVLVRDFTVTYPRFFLPCTIVFNQGGRGVLDPPPERERERENSRELDERETSRE